jgi:hypothetical protein
MRGANNDLVFANDLHSGGANKIPFDDKFGSYVLQKNWGNLGNFVFFSSINSSNFANHWKSLPNC